MDMTGLIQLIVHNMSPLQSFNTMQALIAPIIAELAATTGPLYIGLSGGNTPVPLYQAIAKADIDHARLFFYQVDERVVPPDDVRANQHMIRETLITPLTHSLGGFHYIDTTKPITEAVEKYTKEIEAIPNQTFDLIILGMGSDGHTASLFPGDTHIGQSTALVCHTINAAAPTPPVKDRITLSMHTLLRAKKLILLASGEDKLPIITALLNTKTPTIDFPASFLLTHPQLSILYAKTA